MGAAPPATFSTVDIAVLFVYLVGVVCIGSFFYRRKSNTEDFFFASHSVSWIPISVSIIATNFSAIAYLGLTAFPFQRDLELFPMLMMGPIVVMPIVIHYLVPFYSRLHFSTAYEYLERRFGCARSGDDDFALLNTSRLLHGNRHLRPVFSAFNGRPASIVR